MLTIRLMDNGMQVSGKLGPGFNKDMFLFVESPDKQKKAFLCDLRTSAVNPIRENPRKSAVNQS